MIRRSAVAAMLVALTLGATACTPTAEPTPTPTGFASDEEAFAAAEATYREYLDALNAVDLSEPATFEDVYAWLTGDALGSAKKSFTQMHSDKWRVEGPTNVAKSTFIDAGNEVIIDVCLDVSDVNVVGADGNSVVPDDRPEVQSLRVTLQAAASSTGLKIDKSISDGATPCMP